MMIFINFIQFISILILAKGFIIQNKIEMYSSQKDPSSQKRRNYIFPPKYGSKSPQVKEIKNRNSFAHEVVDKVF